MILTSQIQLFQYGPIQVVNEDRISSLPDTVVNHILFSYLSDWELAPLQVVNKQWQKRCYDYFGLEARKMTQAGVSLSANDLPSLRIHCMDDVLSRVKKFATQLKGYRNGIFACSFPFDPRNHLVIRISNARNTQQPDVTASALVTSKDLKGISHKITITSKIGFTKEISFYENVKQENWHSLVKYFITGIIPATDVDYYEFSKAYQKLESFIVRYLNSPLAIILGPEFNSQLEDLKSKIKIVADKLPKHLSLETSLAKAFLIKMQVFERNKDVYDLFLNPTIDAFDQCVKTPEFKSIVNGLLSTIDNCLNDFVQNEETAECFLQKLMTFTGYAMSRWPSDLNQIDPKLMTECKKFMDIPVCSDFDSRSPFTRTIAEILSKRVANLVAEENTRREGIKNVQVALSAIVGLGCYFIALSILK